ncbi:hypothetical protein Syun_024374 [Stephania yunnanensis]|uniref:TPX2 C-terminal domain-containing protein n=1 Tax=Stephania yunnanensis TaxID=152371 RepID=A0AAP0I498_9MAGN
MGESACLMHTFSCASDTQNEHIEANPIRALGESVSFGRFMSESLAWEKWSSFNHNRYLEEVEKYSKPGSVAQKKAYFEAHYKKIAERKAAALIEQANANSQPENDVEVDTSNALDSNSIGVEEPTEDAVANAEAELPSNVNDLHNNREEVSEIGSSMVEEVDPRTEGPVIVECTQIESVIHREDAENKENKVLVEAEATATKQIEMLPKENSVVPRESTVSSSKMRPSTSSKQSVNSRTTRIPPPPPRTPIHHHWKDNNSTPDSKSYAKDLEEKKRTTPRSVHMSINFAPSRSVDGHKISTPFRKNRDPMVASNLSKTAKDSAAPLRTPSRASVNVVPKPPPATPQSENKRAQPPLEQIPSAHIKMDTKWQSFSVDRSKSNSWTKSWSPTVSSCFRFRSEERAAKRKEYSQKLEERFNAQEDVRLKAKEKAESELKKLRQSLSFKAKPLPDFYRETESSKTQIKKIPLTRPRSPKLGRKPNSSTVHDKSVLPPRTPFKSDGSKDSKPPMEKTARITARSLSSFPRRNARENASPNIQS